MKDKRTYQIGHLLLQPNRQLLDDGKRLPLGSKALALLSTLAEAQGELVSKDELMAAVWSGLIVEENAIQVHIAALRKVMGTAADHLTTVRGIGYRLECGINSATTDHTEKDTANAKPTLAILPFDNLSSDPEMAFFSDGVSEEILSRITHRSMLVVVGRTSSFQFRGKDKADAAEKLRATHVIDGSVQRSGDRVRISTHLLDVATKANLWSKRYDRNLSDIFAVQDEIAEAIADAFDASFFPAETPAIAPAAYDLYLRAKERVTNLSQIERNVASLKRVTMLAGDFAAGWGTLAYRRAELMMHSPWQERAAIRAQIERDIARCDTIDPSNPDALAARWMALPPFGSMIEQEVMLASNAPPNREFVDFLTARAYFLECVGRSNEAAAQAGRAAELDAFNPYAVGLHSQALWFAGHYDQARAAMEYVREKWPDSHHCAAVLIQAFVHLQDWDNVDRMIDPNRLALYPLREHVGVVAFARVMRDPTLKKRRLMFDTICARADATGYIDPQVAVIAAELGFVDETFALLDRCRFGPSGGAKDVMGTHAYRTLLLFPKAYPALRADPRFVKLCARLGLVEYWLTTRNWPDCAEHSAYDFQAQCAAYRDYAKDACLG